MLPIEIVKRFGTVGAGGGAVALADASVVGTQYGQWTIGSDGFTYERHTSGAAVQDVDWINPQSGMSLYECRATVAGGDIPPGTIGSWLDLAASWTWGWTAQTTEKSCTLTIEVRRKSDLTVVDTANVDLFVSGIL